MVDTLRHIGVERFTDIDLMVGDQRWVTTEVPQRYKDWNEPIADGWFLITQSTTEQKFMQLKAINIKLNLDLKIEIGENLKPMTPWLAQIRLAAVRKTPDWP